MTDLPPPPGRRGPPPRTARNPNRQPELTLTPEEIDTSIDSMQENLPKLREKLSELEPMLRNANRPGSDSIQIQDVGIVDRTLHTMNSLKADENMRGVMRPDMLKLLAGAANDAKDARLIGKVPDGTRFDGLGMLYRLGEETKELGQALKNELPNVDLSNPQDRDPQTEQACRLALGVSELATTVRKAAETLQKCK